MRRSKSRSPTERFSEFERSGEASETASNYPLPRAQERVQQAIERDALDFHRGMGGTPISASSVALGTARHGLRTTLPLAERLSRSPQFKLLQQLRVRLPQRVLFCQQRKERREVLFALNRAGYSGSARKKRWRRTQNSQYRC